MHFIAKQIVPARWRRQLPFAKRIAHCRFRNFRRFAFAAVDYPGRSKTDHD
jgi:hypothetical protein